MPRTWLPLLMVIFSQSLSGTKSSPPNIVIFLADDLGELNTTCKGTFLAAFRYKNWDNAGFNDVSWHNSDILTPNLEELARSGLVLENAYMQPMCTASRSALLTGYYPIHTGRQVSSLVIFHFHIEFWLSIFDMVSTVTTGLRSEEPGADRALHEFHPTSRKASSSGISLSHHWQVSIMMHMLPMRTSLVDGP